MPKLANFPTPSPAASAAHTYYNDTVTALDAAETLLGLARDILEDSNTEIAEDRRNGLERIHLVLEAAQGKLKPIKDDVEGLYGIARTSQAEEI